VSNPEASTDDDPLDCVCVVEKKAVVSPPAVPDPTKVGDRRRNNPKVVFPADAIDFERSDIVLVDCYRYTGRSRFLKYKQGISNGFLYYANQDGMDRQRKGNR
jgi:hypothetical protein